MPNLQNIQLITLDLDDTLWPCKPVIHRAEQILFDWLAIQAPQLTLRYDIEAMRMHRRDYARRYPDIAYDLTLLRQAALQTLLEEVGAAPALAAEAVALFQSERNKVMPYDDVPAVLKTLKQRYTLVSVTNGNSQMDETPLRGHFHFSLTAAMAGAAKPDPAMFHQAMQFAQVDPAQTLHVGDDPETDVEAARQLGIQTVWINRNNRAWPDTLPRPAHSIESLDALLGLIA